VLADEAVRIGLANRAFPADVFMTEVEAFARQALTNSWFSHRANKALITATDGLPLAAGLAHEVYANQGVGPDMQARIGAFTGKKG
jgi:enoyl-CoA hydratase/carnithine racemase